MRKPFRHSSLLLATMLLLAGCADTNGGKCVITDPIGTLPVLNNSGSPVIPVYLNGRPAAMIVDSGAQYSAFSERATKLYGLSYGKSYARLTGIGGSAMMPMVEIDQLKLQHGLINHAKFAARSLDLGHIGDLPIVGLFGGDFLFNYDVVFDLPEKNIHLYALSGCSSTPTPTWDGLVTDVRFEMNAQDRVETRISVDGHKIDALLDSGAPFTAIQPGDVRAIGMRQAPSATDPNFRERGVDDSDVAAHLHRFHSIAIGAETYSDPWLAVAEMQTDHALLGADFLRHNRVWISYHDSKFYILRADPPGHDETFHLQSQPKSVPGNTPPALR